MDEAEDVTAVIGVQNAYAVAIDTHDWPALRACFADDASIGFGRPARTGGPDEFLEWAPAFHEALGPTLHQNSSHRVRIDGDAATATAYLHAVLVDADGAGATSIFGRYDDELVRAGAGWLIRRRRFTATWRTRTAPLPASPEGAR
ncbi:SnoaL-like domain-containing protein [Trujillonella endophytica]|uniref:SnoaL-like domain-containing protein n=1 Tax=Trujillonella endophytica TaxID=673521 RepID=A0A1H8Q5I0_9ACTN|nr:SnoaL-like domain-containing protein [Trujillella endophytica]